MVIDLQKYNFFQIWKNFFFEQGIFASRSICILPSFYLKNRPVWRVSG